MSRIHPTGCRMSRPPGNLKKKRKSGQWAVAVLFGGLRSIYPGVETFKFTKILMGQNAGVVCGCIHTSVSLSLMQHGITLFLI
jgi:hypothetical protein